MNKDLPNIYKNNDIKKTHNRDVYYVNGDSNIRSEVNEESVQDKIRKLFKSNKYIFNIGVVIETDKKIYDTKIAGKIKNSIVTIDGESIPIIEIKNIIIKDRV